MTSERNESRVGKRENTRPTRGAPGRHTLLILNLHSSLLSALSTQHSNPRGPPPPGLKYTGENPHTSAVSPDTCPHAKIKRCRTPAQGEATAEYACATEPHARVASQAQPLRPRVLVPNRKRCCFYGHTRLRMSSLGSLTLAYLCTRRTPQPSVRARAAGAGCWGRARRRLQRRGAGCAPAEGGLVRGARQLLALQSALVAHGGDAAQRELDLVGMQRGHALQLREPLAQERQRRQLKLRGARRRGGPPPEAGRLRLGSGDPLVMRFAQSFDATLQHSLALAQLLVLACRLDLRRAR